MTRITNHQKSFDHLLTIKDDDISIKTQERNKSEHMFPRVAVVAYNCLGGFLAIEEFNMQIRQYVYGLPSTLVLEGETELESICRELDFDTDNPPIRITNTSNLLTNGYETAIIVEAEVGSDIPLSWRDEVGNTIHNFSKREIKNIFNMEAPMTTHFYLQANEL